MSGRNLMQRPTIFVLLFVTALAVGCSSTGSGYGGNENEPPYSSMRSTDGYYGVIASIEYSPRGKAASAVTGAGAAGTSDDGNTRGQQDIYFIHVRFDDRSYQTVSQAGLDGLRVGDSVRIERDRVRRY